MATFFLFVIFASFISLGLPDSLLGTAWPKMAVDMGLPLEDASYLSVTICLGTIISSTISSRLIRKFRVGWVTFVSVAMTACALLAYSFTSSFVWLVLFSIPLGLGAGAIDAALNEFVAEHYETLYMSWLHCFWGVGAIAGPIILASKFNAGMSWQAGYQTVAMVQFCLVCLLAFAIPLWGRVKKRKDILEEEQMIGNEDRGEINILSATKIRGVKEAMLVFFLYCGLEQGLGLWCASFLIEGRGVDFSQAAIWTSLYYGGIALGRFFSGILSKKLTNIQLIHYGQLLALAGILLLLFRLPDVFVLCGIIMVGLGCAPIFPCMLHETPARFGRAHAQDIMGFQMATAYMGTLLLPPLAGFISSRTSLNLLPWILLVYLVGMMLFSALLNKLMETR